MKIRTFGQWLGAATIIAMALATPAAAHVGAGDAHGFMHGLAPPIGGLDHVLAMVAVGLLGASLGGRAIWMVPAAFIVMMAAGGLLGMAHASLPYVELGIAASVVVLGLAVALRLTMPTVAAMALVGFFAIFHGFAHGAEMPADASAAGYAFGFMLATALLHAIGIALGLGIGRIGRAGENVSQVGGAALSLAGVALIGGWL
ncbi:HupE/UreJ family protein [Hyphomicrobium sp.]|uniref:HupE/UreJ family protein n=1 Tax=Hyphomicrobium sp. TaxID=82 RepID=UPI0025C43A56|nr:HupE/UreJ family protein [Hyphomicrobium sp.]MCC7253173.1 HupE/UreJ family protein [Hyphomicrobium sp.]